MKRFISVLCVIALTVLMCAPAYASGLRDELPGITLAVKEALEIGDDYTEFTGENFDGRWSLSWSGDDKWINVTCSSEGVIYDYYAYGGYNGYYIDYAPRYPSLDEDGIRTQAEEFLSRVIKGKDEGWLIDETAPVLVNANYTGVDVSGRLTKLGYPTDVTFNMTIDTSEKRVTAYYRSDGYQDYAAFSGDTTSVVSEDEALAMLRDNTVLECVYRVTDPKEPARLVYQPVNTNIYAVRASDGVLIDISEGYNNYYSYDQGAYGAAAEETAAMDVQLTEAELEGISIYDGALSVDELDAQLRAIPELGITAEHVISGSNYYKLAYGGGLCAMINYSRPLSEDEITERFGGYDGGFYSDDISITVNAMTGRLRSLYTYLPGYNQGGDEIITDEYEGAATAFLSANLPEYADNITLVRSYVNDYEYSASRSAAFEYSRTYNGYRFDENSISISINADTGFIDSLNVNWSDTLEFTEVEPSELIGNEKALDAYIGAFDMETLFVSLPVERQADQSMLYELALCMKLVNTDEVTSVDAVTGEAIFGTDDGREYFAYDDIAGIPCEEVIARLGSFGVGFSGGSFMPDSALTFRDALVLIMRANGYFYGDPETVDISELIKAAAGLGAPDLSGYDEEQALTKGELAGILTVMSGYGRAAALDGIFGCGFADDAEIAPEDYGLIAIAYGLGLIDTDADGCINADAPLTRAEAALIFDGLLSIR